MLAGIQGRSPPSAFLKKKADYHHRSLFTRNKSQRGLHQDRISLDGGRLGYKEGGRSTLNGGLAFTGCKR